MFALLEFFIVLFFTKGMNTLNYEYISLKYTGFRFNNTKDSPIGLNLLIKILAPTIYIILISGFLYELNYNNLVKNIYLVTIFYNILRILSIVVLNRILLIKWKEELMHFAISILLSYFIYIIFISKTTQIFISVDEIRDGIWLTIIIFFLSLIIKKVYNNAILTEQESNRRSNNYIINKYNKLKKKYDYIITTKNKSLKKLTYAIMIYEDYNRPKIIRYIEYLKLFFTRRATLGIMQVSTKKFITDFQSVELGYKKLKKDYEKMKFVRKDKRIKKILYNYNKSNRYVEEVIYIYNFLNIKIHNKEK